MGIKKFLNAFRDAWHGICDAVELGRNIRIELLAFAWVMLLVWTSGYGRDYYIPVLLVSALVIGMEIFNTALEKLCDRVTGEREDAIRKVKDMAAGAVLFCAAISVCVALFLFVDLDFWKAVLSGIMDNDRGWALIALVVIPIGALIMACMPQKKEKSESGEDKDDGNN